MRQNVAKVCVSAAKYEFDRPYAYFLPIPLRERVLPGTRVLVPFGRGNRRVEGMVLSLSEREDVKGVKPVAAVLDTEPILSEEGIRLALWMRENCFCTCYEAIRAILPPFLGLTLTCRYRLQDAGLCENDRERAVCDFLAPRRDAAGQDILAALALPEGERLLRRMAARGVLTEEDHSAQKTREKTARAVRIADAAAAEELLSRTDARTARQREALALLSEGEMTVASFCYRTGMTDAVLKTLEKKGIVTLFATAVLRVPAELAATEELRPLPVLSGEQERAANGLWALASSGKPACALLEGVTGSGKTVVYLRLIDRMLQEGRGCIVLVPEIALTPQMIRRFTCHFGRRVAVLHSALSDGERYDQWISIRRGEAEVVIGTRSAVFAPVKNLGLIVLDEEQEYSYKSGEAPRYHAREVAKFRVMRENALLVLGSATPSVESAWAARTGRYSHITLRERFAGATLPRVLIADHKQDLRAGRDLPIGAELMRQIAACAGEGHQAILFLNRRGRNKRVFCTECGEAVQCPRCSVTAAYHSANGRLMCHTCGWSEPMPTLCPNCGSRHLATDHAGTQMVEEQLRAELPEVEVLRMDADTTGSEGSHDELLRRFRERKIPVLIGTQMVAKGLDFENVTLSAVLDADMGLQSEDFRSGERAFSLMMQVAGRAGRGKAPGIAVLQTLSPDNETVLRAASQDYEAFYQAELASREALSLPPFCDLFVLSAASESEQAAFSALCWERERLRALLRALPGGGGDLLGPAPASVARINNRYRFRLTLRAHNERAVRACVAQVLCEAKLRRESSQVILSADVNPYE